MKEKLLLLHGALGTKYQFNAVLPLLQDQYDVYAINFDGHGDVISEQPFSMGLFAQNVKTFLDDHEIHQSHLFGYSMGGYAALTAALQFPERIKKIVTLGTKFDWNEASATQEKRKLNPDKIEEKVPRFAEILKKAHSGQDWKMVVRKTADLIELLGKGGGLSDKDLMTIDHPICIGLGSEDKMVSVKESEHTTSLLSNGRFQIMPNTPHELSKVDTQVLAAHIRSALQ